ncbi:hypothetical protein VM1G_06006 [Cytospora mali]|uniref:HNH nuclease domain-containing protein n=1 Tax=Cytospora mali TaxID=578113 RepID=A0A194W2G0_CYTMA|nr:hypothetical protein VM1G_06006 [Valsa mali]
MSAISKIQRSRSWNVIILVDSRFVAGVYQQDDLLRVRDIAYELELCLTFDKPDDDTVRAWQPALLRKDIPSTSLIVLDQQDSSPFPTPTLGETGRYDYVFHSLECTSGDQHSLEDTCIRTPGMPLRRADPRYLEIGKSSLDQRHIGFQTRSSSLKRRSASSSQVTSLSPSRTDMTDMTDVEIPSNIPRQEGNLLIRNFRNSVFQNSDQGCVISRKGNLGGTAGPGLEAAHIIPQCQWNTYPINSNKDMADPESVYQLGSAWRSTWDGLINVPDLPKSKVRRLIQGDPYKEDPDTQASDTHGSGTQASDTHGSSGIQASDLQTFQPTSYQVTEIPPSPPPSELASEERIFWPSGKESVQGPDTAQQLISESGFLEKISNDEEIYDEEYGRGRSREKRRCIATEENTEDENYKQSRDGVHGAKRQRLDQ